MIGLSGSFTASGAAFAGAASLEAVATPRTVVREGKRSEERVSSTVFEVSGSVRWFALSPEDARTLQTATLGEFTGELRSVSTNDPAWAVALPLRMEAVSPVKLTEVPSRIARGEVAYDVTVEVEALATLTREQLGLAVGAYVLTGESDAYYDIEAEDGATITPLADQTVTLEDGTVLTIGGYEFGDARTAAARIDTSRGGYTDIQTREPAPTGPVAS